MTTRVAVWTTHAYAETWGVLTRLPLVERLELAAVNDLLDALVVLMAPTPLTIDDHTTAARRCASASVRSGAIFDALHLVVAERMKVHALLTFNVKDFVRLAPQLAVLPPPATLTLPGLVGGD